MVVAALAVEDDEDRGVDSERDKLTGVDGSTAGLGALLPVLV